MNGILLEIGKFNQVWCKNILQKYRAGSESKPVSTGVELYWLSQINNKYF